MQFLLQCNQRKRKLYDKKQSAFVFMKKTKEFLFYSISQMVKSEKMCSKYIVPCLERNKNM